jgi:hypothetical protein
MACDQQLTKAGSLGKMPFPNSLPILPKARVGRWEEPLIGGFPFPTEGQHANQHIKKS